MKIIIINGPNLNLLGIREKSIYGAMSFEDFLKELKPLYSGVEIDYFQSNIEGEIIDKIQDAGFDSETRNQKPETRNQKYDGIILNAGGYTHTSVSIADAIAAINTPVIEVHISNIYAREEFRHVSLLSKNCKGVIAGFGLKSYRLAIDALIEQ